MGNPQHLSFGDFYLDLTTGRVRRGQGQLKLTPKAVAVLQYLLARPNQIVNKEELFRALWTDTVVSEAALTVCIRELRLALDDDARIPRYIETVHRRGFRFIAKVASSQHAGVSSQEEEKRKAQRDDFPLIPNTRRPACTLAGREAELARIHRLLENAMQGARQLVFVTGEAGIGKTSLVETFLSSVQSPTSQPPDSRFSLTAPWLAWGQCIEHHGAGEAFLPLLDAVGRLCRGPQGAQLVSILRRHAPMWMVQLPAYITPEEFATLQRKVQGASRERMLREFAEALEAVTAERPFVLVLDDLQWSDGSTLDLLAFLARRKEPARLLVVGMYRALGPLPPKDPLRTVVSELQLHHYCEELALPLLTEADIATYLAEQLRESESQEQVHLPLRQLAQLIHHRTEGNPLFMVTLVDELVRQGNVTPDGLNEQVPSTLLQMITQQYEELSEIEQQVLITASVVGMAFSTVAVAAGLECEVIPVEAQCAALARRGQFVRRSGILTWLDGTVAEQYTFQHALYQQVLYEQIPVSRRLRLHHQIGTWKERTYGGHAREIAVELALHFERAGDYLKAVQYRQHAAEKAMQRYAYKEAIDHLTAGLKLLESTPDTIERTRLELHLQTSLGAALIMTQGYASAEVGRTYNRARELCLQLEETPRLIPILFGLWKFYLQCGELQVARELGEQLFTQSVQASEPASLLRGHLALGVTCYYRGEFHTAREHLEQGIALFGSSQCRPLVSLQDSLLVAGLAYAAKTWWHLGYPDQARQRNTEMMSLANAQSHPFSWAIALYHAASFYQMCRETLRVQAQTETLLALSQEQGFEFYHTGGTLLYAWALAGKSQHASATEQAYQSLGARLGMDAEASQPYLLALLAEACGQAGRTLDGLTLVAEALDTARQKHTQMYVAELHRLKGELTLQQESKEHGARSTAHRAKGQRQTLAGLAAQSQIRDPQGEAEACFLTAINIARTQSAKLWELRATVSLARLWQWQGKSHEAHRMLSEIYNCFTEGFDTIDLQEAKTLIEELDHWVIR